MSKSAEKQKDMKIKVCEYCGRKFKPVRHWQRFCSDRCRWKSWDKRHPRIS